MWLAIGAVLASIAWTQNNAPESFDDLSARAVDAFNAHRTSEAEDLFSRALKLRPNWAEGWWALGTMHYDSNQYEQCRSDTARMVAIDPAAGAGWALLGLCEFETRQFDLSFEHLKRAHMLAPSGASGQLIDVADYHLGLLLTRQGAFEISQEILLRVAEHVKQNESMMFGSGLAVLRIPILPAEVKPEQKEVLFLAGKTFWDICTRPPADAEADFTALLSKYGNFPNAHYFYGTWLAVHRSEAARPEFLKELQVNPSSVPARVQLALLDLVDQNLDRALDEAREAVRLSPDSVGSQLALGRALRAREDHPGALQAFLAAKRLDPVSPEIRLYVVNEYRALGRLPDMRSEQVEYDRLKAELKNWP